MKRYVVAAVEGTGKAGDYYRPAVAGRFVVVARRGGYCLVKVVVAAGASKTAETIADLDARGDSVLAQSLTLAQRAAAKDWLEARGFDVSDWASWGITERRRLLELVCDRVGVKASEVASGWDVE